MPRESRSDAGRCSRPGCTPPRLPVFAVLSVLVAVVYRAVESWLSDYETYARETVARARRLPAETLSVPRTSLDELVAPRSLFGLAFEVRPPPAPA